MTVVISPTLAATLADAETSNNPVIAYDNKGAGATVSGIGTEVQSRAFAFTGTTFDRAVITPNGSNEASIEVDFGSAENVSFVGVAAHNLGEAVGSVRVQYKLLAGDPWTDAGAGVVNPNDNQAIAFYFTAISARYWRLYATGATADVEIGVLNIGITLTLPRRIYQGYAPPITPNVVDLQSNVSEGGNLLGSAQVRKGSQATASLSIVGEAFVRSGVWKDFQRHFNAGGGFFWLWRPTKYGDCFYAWRAGNTIAPTNSGPKAFMSFDMNMRFYDDP